MCINILCGIVKQPNKAFKSCCEINNQNNETKCENFSLIIVYAIFLTIKFITTINKMIDSTLFTFHFEYEKISTELLTCWQVWLWLITLREYDIKMKLFILLLFNKLYEIITYNSILNRIVNILMKIYYLSYKNWNLILLLY